MEFGRWQLNLTSFEELLLSANDDPYHVLRVVRLFQEHLSRFHRHELRRAIALALPSDLAQL